MDKLENFNQYISGFLMKLDSVKPETVSPESYCRRYLIHLLQHKKYYLSIYADVLNKLMSRAGKHKQDMLVIDYGAGNGLLGLFAKYCGFGQIALNDLDEKFIAASRKLSAQLELQVDYYIKGGSDVLHQSPFKKMPDAIIGTDVIEHIYNLKKFFADIQQLNPLMISVFTTASNPQNPFKVKSLQKIQQKDEYEGGEPSDHALFGEEGHLPFIKIREQMIRECYSEGNEEAILELAKATRGLQKDDIIEAVEKFNSTRELPQPAEGFNTCNPVNGSWTERILSLDGYRQLYKESGFDCDFFSGFYNDCGWSSGSLVKKILNVCIPFFGNRISPYIVILGFPA